MPASVFKAAAVALRSAFKRGDASACKLKRKKNPAVEASSDTSTFFDARLPGHSRFPGDAGSRFDPCKGAQAIFYKERHPHWLAPR